MSRVVALLSGKGGSGKTTLALSMASLLSDSGLKVLLVDCDLSTNGATYFYEKNISKDNDMPIASLSKICRDGIEKEYIELDIKKNLKFIPSLRNINEDSGGFQSDSEVCNLNINFYFREARERYDIVIFDCQAGYTNLLESILRLTDVNLVVMEADAISSASVRSLYLKVANIIDKKNVFQIFNKVTKEEDEIYSKISGGTFFTNIGTIIFDWKVRKSFAVAKVPDMENTSSNYGEKVYELCKILFPEREYEESLLYFEEKINNYKNMERRVELEKERLRIKKERSSNRFRFERRILSILLSVTMTAAIALVLFSDKIFMNMLSENLIFKSNSIIATIVMMLTIFAGMITILELTSDRRSSKEKIEIIDYEIELLERNIYDFNKKNEMDQVTT